MCGLNEFSSEHFSGDRLSAIGYQSISANDQLPTIGCPANNCPTNSCPAKGRRSDCRRSGPRGSRNGVGRWAGVTGSLQSLLGTVVIAVFVITFVVQAFQIPSPSMENTLLIGDYLLVNKLCYGGARSRRFDAYREYRRGDIVVFHYR